LNSRYLKLFNNRTIIFKSFQIFSNILKSDHIIGTLQEISSQDISNDIINDFSYFRISNLFYLKTRNLHRFTYPRSFFPTSSKIIIHSQTESNISHWLSFSSHYFEFIHYCDGLLL
jgi:hypothetical protein